MACDTCFFGAEAEWLATLEPARRTEGFLRLWTLKEAYIKATGRGLVVDPSEVLVSGPGEPARLVDWRADEPRPAQISLADVDVTTDDHRAAVAALTDEQLVVEPA